MINEATGNETIGEDELQLSSEELGLILGGYEPGYEERNETLVTIFIGIATEIYDTIVGSDERQGTTTVEHIR